LLPDGSFRIGIEVPNLKCPFCAFETEAGVLVCTSCSRDIVAPPSLIAERDDLVRKLESAREELSRTQQEIKTLMQRAKSSEP
jgi:hypothetical protein